MNAYLRSPATRPELDGQFRPAVLANRAFGQAVKASGKALPVQLALERADGSISRYQTTVLPEGHPEEASNFIFVERLLKFLLWSRGGCKIHFAGPAQLFQKLQAHYRETPTGRFDAAIMGEKIYERPFEMLSTGAESLPPSHEITAP